MAATLDTAPDTTTPALNGDDIFVILETDLVDPAGAAYFDIVFASTGPVAAEDVDLTFNGATITFTVAATTNATATAIPTKDGGDTLDEYAAIVADALRENEQITDTFLVTTGPGTGQVRLTARTGSEITDLAHTGTLTNTTITDETGASPYLEDNLAAVLQVWIAGATSNADTRLATLHATYHPTTAQATFNLRNIFPVAATPPTEASIPPVISLTWPHGLATGAWAEYFLRYADKYGAPAVSEALLKSGSNYVVIHGAKSGNYPSGGSLGSVHLLHRYTGSNDVNFRKPIVEDMPDWIYLYTKAACTDCYVEREATWDNGDTTTIDSSANPFDLATKSVYWFLSGHYPDDFTPPEAGAKIWLFTWRLKGDAGLGVATLAEVTYRVLPCTEWDRFLLFDNGLGGCEAVLFRGKGEIGYKAQRTQARRQRADDHSPLLGDLFTFNQEGNMTFDLRTGYHDRYYIEHLQQLLLGACWMIDMENERFLALVCDTDTVKIHRDDQEKLYDLAVTFNAAWIDQAKTY